MTERSPRDPPFHELHELLGLLAAGETRSKALSAVLGISVRTVRSRLRLLQTWGLVKSAQRAREDRWQLTGAGQRASVPSTVRRLDVVDTHSRPPSLPSRSGDAVTDWTWSTPGDSGMDDEQAAVTAASKAAATRLGLFDELDRQAAKMAARAVEWQMSGRPVEPAPPPLYNSWEDYLERTTPGQRRRWCAMKAAKANSPRLLSGRPETRVTADDVWHVLEATRGRCCHCGSLAVEPRPTIPGGRGPAPWAQVGRRVGSLAHVRPRILGGANAAANLAWSCLWCNDWPNERIPGALDHGGVQLDDEVRG